MNNSPTYCSNFCCYTVSDTNALEENIPTVVWYELTKGTLIHTTYAFIEWQFTSTKYSNHSWSSIMDVLHPLSSSSTVTLCCALSMKPRWTTFLATRCQLQSGRRARTMQTDPLLHTKLRWKWLDGVRYTQYVLSETTCLSPYFALYPLLALLFK